MKKYYDYSFELALSRIYMCFYSDSWGTYIVLSGNMDIPRTPILTCQPDYLEWFMKITVTPTRQNYSRYERKVIFHRLISLQFGSNEKKKLHLPVILNVSCTYTIHAGLSPGWFDYSDDICILHLKETDRKSRKDYNEIQQQKRIKIIKINSM